MLVPSGLGDLVEDLAQETFLRAFRALPDFDPAGPAKLRSWLLTIGTRLAINECERKRVDEPVAIPQIKRFLADWEMAQGEPVVEPYAGEKRPERIAVVGAGPAGLACAHFLAAEGYPVTVLEKREAPGGLLTGAIPDACPAPPSTSRSRASARWA